MNDKRHGKSLTILNAELPGLRDLDESALKWNAGSGSGITFKSKFRRCRGFRWSHRGPWTLTKRSVDQLVQIRITLLRSRIRIRIEVTRWIRFRIKVMRIRNFDCKLGTKQWAPMYITCVNHGLIYIRYTVTDSTLPISPLLAASMVCGIPSANEEKKIQGWTSRILLLKSWYGINFWVKNT